MFTALLWEEEAWSSLVVQHVFQNTKSLETAVDSQQHLHYSVWCRMKEMSLWLYFCLLYGAYLKIKICTPNSPLCRVTLLLVVWSLFEDQNLNTKYSHAYCYTVTCPIMPIWRTKFAHQIVLFVRPVIRWLVVWSYLKIRSALYLPSRR